MQQVTIKPLSSFWRSFRGATWLGWQIESNWTDPLLFAIYSLIRPLTSAFILVVMYSVITQGDFDDPMFAYIYLGSTFYMYVGSVMAGLSWAIIDDREHYKTLKYMYIAPIHIQSYLAGRGVARFLVTTISVVATILVGQLFLNLGIDPAAIKWPLFIVSMLVGVLMLAMMGMILAGISMLIVQHVWFLGEGVAGALYLFSGAIFPLEVLPVWLRWVGYLMPVTYWLELVRRSLVGEVAEAFPTLSGLSDVQILGILCGLTAIFALIARYVFRWCEHQAREQGKLDMVSNY
jgi:ABC-2 type transport system permease protein